MTLNLIPIFGVIGGSCFAYGGVPSAFRALRTGRPTGIPILLAWAIFVGAVSSYIYLLATYGFNPLLTVNYAIEAGSWGVIVLYHYRKEPRQ